MKKLPSNSYSWLIYLIAWLVLVLIQSILIGQSTTTATPFWETPSHYLSTWMLDLFLILTFCLNYYYVAGAMMRRRLFGGYVAFVLVIAAIALFMPIICKALFGWQTPTEDLPSVSISWLGAIGAITVITIGLAVRALLEWLKLNKLTSEQRDELIKLRNEWTVLKGQAKGEDPTSSTPEPARRPEDLHAKETADTKHISPKASDL